MDLRAAKSIVYDSVLSGSPRYVVSQEHNLRLKQRLSIIIE